MRSQEKKDDLKANLIAELRASMKQEIKREVERQVQEMRVLLEHEFNNKLQKELAKV